MTQPYPTRRRPASEGCIVVDPVQLNQAERVSLDKFEPRIPYPFPARRQPTREGDSENDAKLLTAKEIVRVDKFNPNTMMPKASRAARVAALFDADNGFLQAPVGGETITQDKWAQPQSQPIPDVRRSRVAMNADSDNCFTLPAVERTTIDKWIRPNETPRAVPRHLVQYGVNTASAEQSDDGLPPEWFSQQNVMPVFVSNRRASLQPQSQVFITENVTQDKWAQPVEQPYSAKQKPVRTGAQILGDVPRKETVSVDRWNAKQDSPRWAISQRYLQSQDADNGFMQIVTSTETITVDKWYRNTEQPRANQRRLVQYGVNFAIAEQADDGLPPQNWQQPVSQPQSRLASRAHVLASSASDWLAHTPVVVGFTLDSWYQNTQTPRATSRRLIQYGVNCAIDQQADDGLPPTWWMLPTEVPIFVLGSRRHIYQTVASDNLSHVPNPETITVDKWWRLSEQPYPARRQPTRVGAFGFDVVPRGENITLDKWWQLQSQPFPARTQPTRTGAFSFDVFPRGETLTLDKWWQVTQQPYPSKRRLVSEGFLAFDVVPRSESVSFDRWNYNQSTPRWDVSRRQHLWPVEVSDYLSRIPTAETITLDKFWQLTQQPFPAKRKPTAEGFLAFDVVPRVESVSFDRWNFNQERPRWVVNRRQYVFATSVSDQLFNAPNVENVTVDKWGAAVSQPYPARRTRLDYAHITSANAPQLPSDAFFAAWASVSSNLVPRRVVAPVQSQVVIPQIVRPVTVDSWFVQTSIPRWDVKRLAHLRIDLMTAWRVLPYVTPLGPFSVVLDDSGIWLVKLDLDGGSDPDVQG